MTQWVPIKPICNHPDPDTDWESNDLQITKK